MSTFGAKILSRFVQPAPETSHGHDESLEQARATLLQLDASIEQSVRGKVVLDFGSGEGWYSLAFGKMAARKVYGIDIEAHKTARSRQRAKDLNLSNRVIFETSIPAACQNACDLILSRDSMEHYSDPEGAVQAMKRCLSPRGQILISFGPTWYSPYGAHMNYFIPIPWVHLLFSERSIMEVRSRFRKDGARRYEEVPGGLNRMSVRKFETVIKACGLKIAYMEHRCVKGNQWLGKLPISRELFINSIVCKLER